MKIKSIYCIIFFLLIVGGVVCLRDVIHNYVYDYALKVTQQQFGTLPLAFKQEAKIRQIADEMKIYEPLIIRKMNRQTLLAFGYYNAFAYFPKLLNCIPISGQSFLFVSEGFFEELSPEEQRFLIGHELIHIQEHHTQYLNLLFYIFILLSFIVVSWFIKKVMKPYIHKQVALKYQTYSTSIAAFFLFYISLIIPNLCSLAYRRHIEWVADERSLSLLNSHDGAIKLMERWQKDFSMPLHNPYYGLFADHPSCHERKIYCLNLKNKSKELV